MLPLYISTFLWGRGYVRRVITMTSRLVTSPRFRAADRNTFNRLIAFLQQLRLIAIIYTNGSIIIFAHFLLLAVIVEKLDVRYLGCPNENPRALFDRSL